MSYVQFEAEHSAIKTFTITTTTTTIHTRGREFVRSPATARLRNDSGQVVHTDLPRRRLPPLPHEAVKHQRYIYPTTTTTTRLVIDCFRGNASARRAAMLSPYLLR